MAAVTQGRSVPSGVPHADELLAFAEAIVAGDPEVIALARVALERAMGPAAVVDAAAVAGNFERMVRIADGTGIPLDTPVKLVSADLREELGLDRFGSARETAPTTAVQRLLGRLLRPIVPWLARRMMGRRERAG